MHTRRHRGSRKTHRRRTRSRNTRNHRRHKGGFIQTIIDNNPRVKDGLSKVNRLTKVGYKLGSAIPGIIEKATESHPKIQIDNNQKELESATRKLAQLTNEEQKREMEAKKAIDKQKGVITRLRSKIAGLNDRLIKKTSQSTSN